MSRLDSSVQKATKNILHSLYESALSPVTEASGASTQQQINRDKPEDAPKETKDALVKKVQNDKIPTKTLKETENSTMEKIKSGEKVYLRQDGTPMVIEYADDYPAPGEYDQGYDSEDLAVAEAAAEDKEVWVVNEVDENNLEQTGPVLVYIYGDQELYDFLGDKKEVRVVTRLEESAECEDKSLKEGIEDALKQAEDQVAELQDYLDNTPEIADDEKESIQNEINELLDQIEYYRNEMSFTESSLKESTDNIVEDLSKFIHDLGDDSWSVEKEPLKTLKGSTIYRVEKDGQSKISNEEIIQKVLERFPEISLVTGFRTDGNRISFTDNAISESSLTEAPNPENADINKKILNTIRTKRDKEPRYKSDLEAVGLTVEPDKYNDSWSITGTNGRKITKDNFLGGKDAEFNAKNNKVVDYYNRITKEDPNFDKKSYWTRESRFGRKTNQKGRAYNFDTHEYEDKQIYDTKQYNQRQRDSRSYDFNNLRNGSKNIRDYSDAAKTAKDEEPGSWSNRYNNENVDKAKAQYDSFMNSISDKIKELQDKIKKAEEYRDRDLKTGEEAEKRRQEILNNARAKRNKGGNI